MFIQHTVNKGCKGLGASYRTRRGVSITCSLVIGWVRCGMQKLKLSLQVFKVRDFSCLWTGRILAIIANLILSVTIGWQVYVLARVDHSIEQSAFLVGMVGLAEFVPMFALALLAGEAADRYDRRKMLALAVAWQFMSALGQLVNSNAPHPSMTLIFAFAMSYGVANAFAMPAVVSLAPMLVPSELLPRAIAWNVLSRMIGTVLGPWIGGALCAISATFSYGVVCGFYVLAIAAFISIRANTKPEHNGASRVEMIREGLSYIWKNKLVFGAITLDLFAVFLGGATALLPVYARDILDVGANGFGILRSAAAMGGGLMSLALIVHPIESKAGALMLWGVAVFGAATIVFGLSTNMTLSVVALVILGAADVISVFVRQSLVQIVTPEAMRGRVSAVSGLFISASNELGEFESGVTARFMGPVAAAVFGGVGSILVTAIWAKLFPDLRKANDLKGNS